MFASKQHASSLPGHVKGGKPPSTVLRIVEIGYDVYWYCAPMVSTVRTLYIAHKFVYISSTKPTPFFPVPTRYLILVAKGKTRCVPVIIEILHVFTAPINLKSLLSVSYSHRK